MFDLHALRAMTVEEGLAFEATVARAYEAGRQSLPARLRDAAPAWEVLDTYERDRWRVAIGEARRQ